MHRRLFLGAAAAMSALPLLPARADDGAPAGGDRPAPGAVRMGVLLPLSGPAAAFGRMMLEATLLAVEEVNRRPGRCRLALVPFDSRSQAKTFAEGMKRLVKAERAVAVLAPVPPEWRAPTTAFVEQSGGLLCDPAAYEGGECSRHVVHCGATPHQLLKQFIPWLVREAGPRVLIVAGSGSLSHEMARVARAVIGRVDGEVLGGDAGLEGVAQRLRRDRPDVLFSTLCGDEAAALLRERHQIGSDVPVASPFLDERVVAAVGPRPAAGAVAVSTWFAAESAVDSTRFATRLRLRLGRGAVLTAAAEAAYAQVHLLAEAVDNLGGGDVAAATLREAIKERHFVAPQGEVSIEGDSLHARLWPRIAVVGGDGRFRMVARAGQPLRGLPYWSRPGAACTEAGPRLAPSVEPPSRQGWD
ncbi:MAG: transporter substrate-binding protein [Magnetospirillum sp.]|nr:transporter substrate-binding protein [Magnetospirillum sp.]